MRKKRIEAVVDDVIRRFSDSKTKSVFIRGSHALGYATEFSDLDIGILVDRNNLDPMKKRLHLRYGHTCVHITFFSFPEIIKELGKTTHDSTFPHLARTILHAKPVYDPSNTIEYMRRRLEGFPPKQVIETMLYEASSTLTDALAALKSKRYSTALLNLRFLALTCAKLLVLSEKGYWKDKWLILELEKISGKYMEEAELINEILSLDQNPEEIQELLLKAIELCLRLESQSGIDVRVLSLRSERKR